MGDRLPRVLAVRLDNDGDVLLTGPAIRALRAGSARVDLLVSPRGEAAARLLPGVDDVIVLDASWIGFAAPPVDPGTLTAFVDDLRGRAHDQAVIFTSFHQSALPTALLARWAGVPRVVAASEDHPGSLLDVRHRRMPEGAVDDGGAAGGHEVTAAIELAEAAGFPLPRTDDRHLRVKAADLPPFPRPSGQRYVVVHPAASAPSRAIGARSAHAIARALLADGWDVVVTGGPGEESLCAEATPAGATCLAGRTTLAELAAVLSGAAAVVVGNTGPAHLAAAVGTPVVSLFSPVVPVERWGPWGVPHVVLGDQYAPCRGSRATGCPVPGHPCLSTVTPRQVGDAVRELAGIPDPRHARVRVSTGGAP